MRHTCLPIVRRLLIGIALPAVLATSPTVQAQNPPFSIGNRDAGAESTPESLQRLPSPSDRQSGDRVRGVDIDRARRGPAASQTQPADDGLLGESLFGPDRAVRIVEDRLLIPPLIVPTIDQSSIGNSVLPTDRGSVALGDRKPLPEGPDREGDWAASPFLWQAPNTFSHPLYFEDVMLERHGHERFGCLQPLAAGTRFFATIPMLPYLMAVREPCDCDYHLGYYQVGTCAPPLLQRPPYDRRAALIQGGFIGGMILIFP